MHPLLKKLLPTNFFKWREYYTDIRRTYRCMKTIWKIPKRKSDECLVICGGESIRKIQSAMIDYSKNCDVYVVNNFMATHLAQKIKPYVCFWADPAYFSHEIAQKTPYLVKSIEIINTYDKPIYLAVPYKKHKKAAAVIHNKNVSIIGLPSFEHPLTRPFRAKLLKIGFYGFGFHTVSSASLGFAVIAGYKKIWLAGADLSLAPEYSVDELCLVHRRLWSHYSQEYGRDPRESVICKYTYATALRETLDLHLAFENIRDFACYCGTEIINLSPYSMLDMFPKGRIGEKPFSWKPENDNTNSFV